jgi:hypothetical protein
MNVRISWNIFPSISVSEPLQYQEMKHIHQVWKHTLTTALFRIHYCMFAAMYSDKKNLPEFHMRNFHTGQHQEEGRPLARSHQVLRSKTNVPIS